MQSSTHARHNIFTAEPLNSKSKKASKDNLKKVHFDDPTPINTPPPSRPPSQPAAKSTPPPSRNLDSIDFNARQKLAVKDLSVKYIHKSPTFNVNTTLGSPSSSNKLANAEDRAANILNDMFAFDDDVDANSLSKASVASLRTQSMAGMDNSPFGPSTLRSSLHNLDSQLDSQSLAKGSFGMTTVSKPSGRIMPNSYFFNDSHSVIEVEDEDDIDTKHSTVIVEEDGQGRIIQPHPKVFTSPLDAHKSFMNASKSRRPYRSMPNVKSIPTDLIANESKKAIISMKIASRSSNSSPNHPSRKGSSRSDYSTDSNRTSSSSSSSARAGKTSSKDKGLFSSSKFFFLSSLTRSPIQEVDDEDDADSDHDGDNAHPPPDAPHSSPGSRSVSTKHDHIHGQKAPLESTQHTIVERPLRTSTFTRFRSHAAISSPDGENHATLLRSLDSVKQSSQRREDGGGGLDDTQSVDSSPWSRPAVVSNSAYHVPQLAVLERGKGLLHTVDRLIAKWTSTPKPEKPRTPSPVEEEPLTAQSLFGEHLIKADLSQSVPEDELERLMRLARPPRSQTGGTDHTEGPLPVSRGEIARPTPLPAVAGAQRPPPPSPAPLLPLLDLSPVRPSPSRPGEAAAPQSASLYPPGFLPRVVHPVPSPEQSSLQSYLSFLSPASQSFLSSFLGPDPAPVEPSEAPAALCYQHSTTSYVPRDVVNRSALGFDHLARSPPPRVVRPTVPTASVFSERHLANIALHTAGSSEPVIYLPGGEARGDAEDKDAYRPVLFLDKDADGDDVVDEDSLASRRPWPTLPPGRVLSAQTSHEVERRMHRGEAASLWHDAGNIFEDRGEAREGEGDEEEDGADEARDSPVWTEYIHFLDRQDGGGQVAGLALPLAPGDKSTPHPPGQRHGLARHDATSPRTEGSRASCTVRSLEAHAHLAEMHTPSSLDLRGEIAAFLRQQASPLQQEYDAYVHRTQPVSGRAVDGGERWMGEDASTIASQDRPGLGSYGEDSFGLDSPRGEPHDRLRMNLLHRYSHDREGHFQMQRRVQKYLREGVRADTQIQRKYAVDDDDDGDGW